MQTRAHIIDSQFFADLFGTDEMRRVFSDDTLLRRWLEVEVALARAEAEVGVIPAEAAEQIAAAATGELDRERIRVLVEETVHPLVPVIRVFSDACGEAGQFVHWGATTQDIMDTASVLQVKDALEILEGRLAELSKTFASLAHEHSGTVMAGRTHGQHALPITFGFKVAGWLAELERHRERLAQARPRLLVGQLGGAVGTLASLGDDGIRVQELMMESLGLGRPVIAWHTSRDSFAEFAGIAGALAGLAGRVAREIVALQKTEVAELEEPHHAGRVGSSTMPHKRNPMLCEAIMSVAGLAKNLVPNAFDGLRQEHERDMGVWQMEWAWLGELSIYTDAALHLLVRVTAGLVVHRENMLVNLEESGGLIVSEAVMIALGRHTGLRHAHEIVSECAAASIDGDKSFLDVLKATPAVTAHLSNAELDRLLDPSTYTGLARQFTADVISSFERAEYAS
jgi:adenylosuccinate lyase